MKEKQDMINMFKGYKDYSNDEYKRVWEDSVIVVDANILLNFYRYSEDTRDKIFEILGKLKKRLWIPYQVGKEFFENRDKVKVNSYNEYEILFEALQKDLQEAKDETNKRKNDQLKCKTKINDILDQTLKEIQKLLNAEKSNKKPKFSEDDIENKILDLFNNSIDEPIVGEEYEKMKAEGLRRFKELIPPGYKDREKEENGDYYIFYSLIEKAKVDKKDIIFVTDDVKEDWFNRINGEIHGGRYELLNEFYKKTNKLLMIYTCAGFAEAYNKNINHDFDDEDIINELKAIGNMKTNNFYNREYYDALESYKYDIKSLNNKVYFDILYKYKDDVTTLNNKEELLNALQTLIEKADIPNTEKKRMYYDLRIVQDDFYHNVEYKNIRLENIINKVADYYRYHEKSKIDNQYLIKEKYYNYLHLLRNCKSELQCSKIYYKLKKCIEKDLNYLLHEKSQENIELSNKLEKVLYEVAKNMKSSEFMDSIKIVKALEYLLDYNLTNN